MAEEKVYANLNAFPVTLPSPKGGQRTFAPNEIIKGDWWSKMVGTKRLSEIDPTKYNIIGRRINQGINILRKNATGQPVAEKAFTPAPTVRTVVDGRIGSKPPTKSKIETLCDGVCESGCEQGCEGACELNAQSIQEEEHYRIIGDTKFCRYCDYNSSKVRDVEKHLENVHPKETGKVVANIATAPDVPKPKVAESENVDLTKETAAVAEEKPEVLQTFEDATAEDVPDTEPEAVKKETTDYIDLGNGTFECKACGKVCKSKAGLARHINTKHRG